MKALKVMESFLRWAYRKGVKIDIGVRPTNEEIRNGQDVWIEKAIEYILKYE